MKWFRLGGRRGPYRVAIDEIEAFIERSSSQSENNYAQNTIPWETKQKNDGSKNERNLISDVMPQAEIQEDVEIKEHVN
jgi:hypothetical protein